MNERGSGILMHITSLPSSDGIGTFGKEAYKFIDFLEKSGQKYWQVLPLGPTGYGDSPYQSFSSFAGNPYFIDLDIIIEEGLLNKDDTENIDFGDDPVTVDYEKICKNKMALLKKAYEHSKNKYNDKILKFKEKNSNWLEEYGLYMSLKGYFGLKSWVEWDHDIKFRKQESITYYTNVLRDDINFWIFLQYLFYKQWLDLKQYGNKKGIKVIGDIPIYIAEDSVDTWVNSEIFLLDKEKKPIKVAGCPPDAFSETGQLWGNPIYRWDILEKRGFDWWIERIKNNCRLYDLIRIDHFRGLESYWEIPYGDDTAINGRWVKGPGMKLFNAIKESLGDVNIIVEDLGFLTREVIDLRKKTGYPGMKVLQFAFDRREESDYLPHNYDKNCVVYTGTHDNDTVNGWLENADRQDIEYAIKYLRLTEEEGYNWGFIRGAWSSVADIAIAQMQDFLALGSEARINIPSTIGGNWKWRVKKEDLSDELACKIYELTKTYGR